MSILENSSNNDYQKKGSMRVFVTGATGFVGEAIMRKLLSAGHQVLGLARSETSAARLAQLGAAVHPGDLTDIDSIVSGAKSCDGVIHTAFIHDFSAFAASVETDRMAVEALASALEGSGKPFVSTSGIAMLPSGRTVTEGDVPAPGTFRSASEQTVLEAAKRGVRSSVVRLPPSVHGAGDHGFVPALIDIARRKGFSAFVGDGTSLWPAVHRMDAARVYRLALEQAIAGTPFHAVAEKGIPLSAIAQVIGTGLGLPVRSITKEEAKEHFEWMAHFVNIINHTASSDITSNLLGWSPQGPGLLADMQKNYFG